MTLNCNWIFLFLIFMTSNCNWIFLLLMTSHLWGEFNFELMALMELGILIHVSVFNVSPLTKDLWCVYNFELTELMEFGI